MDNESKELTTTNGNDSNSITESEVNKIIADIVRVKPIDKKQRFHMYRIFNLPIKLCAKLSGYKESYGYQLVREYKNDGQVRQRVEKIISDMPDAYRNICKMRLLKIAEIEGKALQEYDDKPELAIERPQLLKQIKQGGGINLQEMPAVVPTINIETMQVIGQMLDHDTQPESEGTVIDIVPGDKPGMVSIQKKDD